MARLYESGDSIPTALHEFADRLFDLLPQQRVTIRTTGHRIAIVSNCTAIRQRNRSREKIEATKKPFGENVLIAEWLGPGLGSANETTMAKTNVIYEAFSTKEDHFSLSVYN